MDQQILTKIEKLEKRMDSKDISEAQKALWDFDIEKFITPRDFKVWKK